MSQKHSDTKEVKKDVVKQVIVMRKDLGMRKGKMVAQGAHASMKVFFDQAKVSPQYPPPATPCRHSMRIDMTHDQKAWVEGLFTKICVSVPSELELLRIYVAAQKAELPVALIEDAGLTEFNGVSTITCIAIGPAKSTKIDPLTRHLELL